MISVEEALEKVLSHFDVLEAEDEELLDSLGQVIAEDIHSTINIPGMDNSAMDGYAVQAQSTVGATRSSPNVLRVTGEVAAGYLTKEEEIRKAQNESLTEIGVLREVEKGLNIRRAGEDIYSGSLVLRKGTVIRPQEVGVLASLGQQVVPVIRRPLVAILATGDELVDVGTPLPLGKIYTSNTYSLAAQVTRYGGIPQILGIARDNVQALEEKLKEARDADLIITSAGVSMGDYDVVKDVLAKHGEVTFWTVCMKPGKPLAFGQLRVGKRMIPHLGLPGNPVSSMITFEQFARPAILKMLGRKDFEKATIHAKSESHVKNTDGRRIFARVLVSKQEREYHARLVGRQGSGILTSMAQANGLMIVPEDVPAVSVGDTVVVQMLDWNVDI